MWQYVLIGMGILIAAILLKKYFSQQMARSENAKFCFECNKQYPDSYVLCPRCGIKFGA